MGCHAPRSEPRVVPGSIQISAYTRGMHEGGSSLSADDLGRIVTGRIARQEFSECFSPPLLVAVLDHNVLGRPVGGPKTRREQLLHLIDVAERPTMT